MKVDSFPRNYEHIVPAALVLAAFGPVLLSSIGVRTDHLVLYGLLPIAFGLLCVRRSSILFSPPILTTFLILLFITTWTLVVTLGGVESNIGPSSRTGITEFQSLENYAQGIAVILVMGGFLRVSDMNKCHKLLIRIGSLLIFMVSLNAIIALASIFLDTLPITKYFIRESVGTGDSRYEITAEFGRMTGIFGFPSAAGVAYSLTIFIWAYLVRQKNIITVLDYFFGALVIIGGVISVSKIFLFGGLPLFLIYWLLPGRKNSRISIKLLFLLIALSSAVITFIESWIGLDRLTDLFISNESFSGFELFWHFIQIRYGFNDQGGVTGIFPYVWSVAPIQGLGFAYLESVDSAYQLYFMQGGLVSIVLYIGIIAFLIFLGATEWFRGQEIGRLLTILGLFVLIAGIGAPVVTLSRVGLVFWVILTLVLAVRSASASCEDVRTRYNAASEANAPPVKKQESAA